jgi:hypothetical protein
MTGLCRLDGIVHMVARRGRQRAERQQLQQEKVLVDHLLRLHRNGYPTRVKHLRSFAGIPMGNGQVPAKDWPQAFYKRHPELKAASMKAIDWQRHEKNIRAKVEHWFEIMEKQLLQREMYRRMCTTWMRLVCCSLTSTR